jgi:hypothetical protein
MDTEALKDRVLRKLKALMTGMPHGLEPSDKLKAKQLQFNAAKTLIAYFQKQELSDPGKDEDIYNLPKNTKDLKAHLAKIGEEMNEDESE